MATGHDGNQSYEPYDDDPDRLTPLLSGMHTPKSVETAYSAHEKKTTTWSMRFSAIRRFFGRRCEPVTSCCTMTYSKSRLLGLLLLLIEVSICIVLIINWHTKTNGSINIGLDQVEILIIIYMVIGMAGMLVIFRKRNSTSFVIFSKSTKQASKYLVSGVYAFGGGSIFMSTILLFTYAHCPEKPCHIFFSAIHFIFTLSQILFLQRFYLATFQRSASLVFLLVHIFGTNICVWALYLIEETKLFSYTPVDRQHDKCVKNNNVTKLAENWEEYMIPFSMEFCLICAGLVYSMISSMKYFPEDPRSRNEAFPYASLEDMASITSDVKSKTRSALQKRVVSDKAQPYSGSHPGFLAGLAVSLIMTVSALVIEQKDSTNHSLIFHHTLLSLVSISQLVSIIILRYSLRHYEYKERMLRSDDALLIISLSGLVIWHFLCMIAAISKFNERIIEGVAIAIFLLNVLNMTTALAQCVVIIQGLRYRNHLSSWKIHLLWKTNEMENSMIRISQAVVYVLVTNIGLWIQDTLFEIKHYGTLYYPVGNDFYGGSWKFWSSLLYPLAIFFRFHSATLLYEILAGFQKWYSNDEEEELKQRLRRNSLPTIDSIISTKPSKNSKRKTKRRVADIDPDDIFAKHKSSNMPSSASVHS